MRRAAPRAGSRSGAWTSRRASVRVRAFLSCRVGWGREDGWGGGGRGDGLARGSLLFSYSHSLTLAHVCLSPSGSAPLPCISVSIYHYLMLSSVYSCGALACALASGRAGKVRAAFVVGRIGVSCVADRASRVRRWLALRAEVESCVKAEGQDSSTAAARHLNLGQAGGECGRCTGNRRLLSAEWVRSP